MKISTKQYAQGLYEATKSKKPSEIEGILANLVGVLAKNNQLKLKNGIIKKFSEIYNRENGIVSAEVISREGLDEDVRRHLLTYVRTRYGAKEVELKESVDQRLKGGVIMKVDDEILDGSIDRKLKRLREAMA